MTSINEPKERIRSFLAKVRVAAKFSLKINKIAALILAATFFNILNAFSFHCNKEKSAVSDFVYLNVSGGHVYAVLALNPKKFGEKTSIEPKLLWKKLYQTVND